MLKLVADEDFNHKIVRGLRREQPTLDIVRVQEVDLMSAPDPTLLEWAAGEGRVVLTHDVTTMTKHAFDRANQGQKMPGVIEVSQKLAIGFAIKEVLLVASCSFEGELEGQVIFVPV